MPHTPDPHLLSMSLHLATLVPVWEAKKRRRYFSLRTRRVIEPAQVRAETWRCCGCGMHYPRRPVFCSACRHYRFDPV